MNKKTLRVIEEAKSPPWTVYINLPPELVGLIVAFAQSKEDTMIIWMTTCSRNNVEPCTIEKWSKRFYKTELVCLFRKMGGCKYKSGFKRDFVKYIHRMVWLNSPFIYVKREFTKLLPELKAIVNTMNMDDYSNEEYRDIRNHADNIMENLVGKVFNRDFGWRRVNFSDKDYEEDSDG